MISIRKQLKVLPALVIPLALAGCNATMPKSLTSAIPGAEQPIPEKTMLAQASEIREANADNDPGAGVRRFSSVDYDNRYVVNSNEINGYLQSIGDRLLDSWEGEKPEYAVTVVYGDELNAHVTSHQNIFLPTGWIHTVESEDELAAILAHELAHIILRHPYTLEGRKQGQHFLQDAGEWATTLTVLSGMRGGMNGGQFNLAIADQDETAKRMFAVMAAGTAIYEIKRSLIDPDISRTQEEQADFLAVDLLDQAGYNRNAFLDVMQRLANYRADVEDRVAKLEKKHEEAQGKLQEQVDGLMAQGNFSAGMGAAIGGITEIATDQAIGRAQAWLAERRRTHFDPDYRSQRARAYLRTHYSRSLPPATRVSSFKSAKARSGFNGVFDAHKDAELALNLLKAGETNQASRLAYNAIRTPARHSPYPWMVLAEVRHDQRRINDAVENYELAIQRKGPPDVYQSLAQVYWQQGEYERALGAIEEGRNAYDDDDVFLPFAAQMNGMLGRNAEAEKIVKRCQSTGNRKLKEECEAVKKNLGDS
ncbi:M48 family metalloprotease [Guyparkeria sp. TX1]|uniref:M48 family metalloprotease n=1 Tax=Guyparkeria sp. TX1 TaxID=3115001 RepID=UPI0039774D83